jgi:uncharacterized RDD family membrane protein YckC
MVLLLIVAGVIADAGTTRDAYGNATGASTASAAISVGWLLFLLCYQPACWYFFGGTVGQRAFGLRVVRAADGRPLGLGSALVRFVIFAVSTATVILGLIAAVMASDDPFKRAWHDEAARSVVVRRL